MARALATIAVCASSGVAKATLAIARSSLPTIDARQKGRAGFASRGLSHGHVPHQSDARVYSSPRSIRNWRAQSISPIGCVRLSHSARIAGVNRLCAQSVSDQHLHKLAVREIHHQPQRLSKSSLRPDQYGRKDFQNAGNIFQEGARQNDR